MDFRPKILTALGLLLLLGAAPHAMAQSASGSITLKTDFHMLWEMNLAGIELYRERDDLYFNEFPIEPMEDDKALLVEYMNSKTVPEINLEAIEDYLKKKIAPEIDRAREDVTIDMSPEGKVTFEGKGFYGRKLDVREAAKMIAYAIKNDIRFVTLPLIKEDPIVTVKSEKLREMGIKELISAGETNFGNSPANRITNIKVGNATMNGRIVKPGEKFAYGVELGEISQRTGYKPELVIKGAVTVPEYGGGLCQVSTTAYRAALSAGLPITKRRNHSYAVSYYTPYGLDATIYPPSVDMHFVNDMENALLIQAFENGTKVHYNFYGTKTNRKVYMVGPYNSGWISPPATKVEYTDKLAPGEKRYLSHSVPGLTTNWYRQVIYPEDEKEEGSEKKDIFDHIFSKYQARPDYIQIGRKSVSQAEKNASLENGY